MEYIFSDGSGNFHAAVFPEYEQVKPHVNSKYFTRAFYRGFTRDYTDAIEDIVKTGEKQRGYFRTKQTAFYQKDGGRYCQFLQDFDGMLPKFRVDRFQKNNWNCLVSRSYEYFPGQDAAETIAAVDSNFAVEVSAVY